jgi:ASC-1-like (ASCH) protein
MKIEKKVQKEYFDAVADGRKRFEVRLADFESKPGDTLVLKEQAPVTNKLTGRELDCEVLYKFNTKDIEKFYSKADIEKYGLVIIALRKKYDFK